MTVTTVGATDPTQGIHRPGGPPPGMKEAMGALADKLGMSSDDLETQMRSGKSLADIASAHGVSKDDAQKTLADAIKANAPQGANITDDRANKIAARMMDGPKGGHHHHHKVDNDGDGDASGQGAVQRLQDGLGGDETASSIITQLQSGEDLDTIAGQAGMSKGDLINTLAQSLKVDERA